MSPPDEKARREIRALQDDLAAQVDAGGQPDPDKAGRLRRLMERTGYGSDEVGDPDEDPA
jgi:hypothetical protein